MGRLFDSLQVMGKLDNTDIIFIGDNGDTQKTTQSTDTARAKGTVAKWNSCTVYDCRTLCQKPGPNNGRISEYNRYLCQRF
ncbi:MAG: hypothetical protein IPL25_15855 [Saprospiraceae bacterium]|nr:hypothetical protein [Candidatus Vicinibacter affinis]